MKQQPIAYAQVAGVVSMLLASVIAGAPLPASAQQPPADPVQDVITEWQANQIAQSHLLKSVQGLVDQLQAARTRVQQLEDELKTLKAAAEKP